MWRCDAATSSTPLPFRNATVMNIYTSTARSMTINCKSQAARLPCLAVRIALGLAVLWIALVASPAAQAGTPVLTAVGHQDGHLTANWTLPEYTEVWGVKVSTTARSASNGDFFEEDVVLWDSFSGTQHNTTSYLSSERLKPGVYFVKVYGYDNICFYVPYDDPRQCGVVYSRALLLTVSYPPVWRLNVNRLGKTMFVATISNLNGSLLSDPIRAYRICWTRRAKVPACKSGKFIGTPTDEFIPITNALPNVTTIRAYIDGSVVATKRFRVR